MRIDRQQVEDAFEAFVRGGGGAVIGAPGSGKSYLLRKFVEDLLEDGTAYPLFLPVDRFPDISETSLAAELGAEGDVFAFLEADAAEATHAYFIIDALDAARSDRGRTQLMNLLRRARRQLSERWRVIVSVRTYDALRSEELEVMFGPVDTDVAETHRLGGVVCRHFFVPPLTDEEVLSAVRIPGIADIWAGASLEVRDILRTPFSLWVLDRVVTSGGAGEISGVHSEVELLSLFWRLRVDAGELGIERRLVLERVADAMLAARALSVPTSDVYRSAEQAGWHALHSGEILNSTTIGHSRTAFSHNILFDYAISVLNLDIEEGPRAFLEQDPSRALFLRPSLNYFFLRLWYHDRPRFWESVFNVARSGESQVRLFTRVLPPTIIAAEARSVADLAPLLERLDGDDAAPEIVLRVLQALRFSGVPRPEVWAPVCERFAKAPDTISVWELALVLDQLSQVKEMPDIHDTIGSAARSLLQWAFDHRAGNPTADRLGSVWLVPLVAHAIETDTPASSALLMRVVEGIGDAAVPVDYAYRLADHLDRVWPTAPELAALFFHRCFAHVELSEERTHMGGIVVALTSNRRQDFDMVQWSLKQHAPAFLRGATEHAVPALVESINAQIHIHELAGREEPAPTLVFEFNGLPATYTRDGSHFWDATGTIRGDAQELMDILAQYMDELADEGDADAVRGVLADVAAHARMAFIWRRLLALAARRPETYTPLLSDLLVAEPILSGLETVREAAEFIEASLPNLSERESLAVERAVVAIGATAGELDYAPVGRLIQRFPDERLQTEEGRQLKEATLDNVNALTNRPLVELHTSFGPYTEEMWLAEQGVDVGDASVRQLTELAAPVKAFEDDFRNAAPTGERVAAVLVDLERLRGALSEAQNIPEAVQDATWAKLGGAAGILARHQAELEPTELALVRRVLLDCAYGRAPSPETAGEFTTPAWSPAARNEAAQGLAHLAPTPEDEEVVAAIRALTVDPVPSVRWLIAADLWRICESSPEVFWEIAHGYLASETNAAVLDAVARSLGAVASVERQPQVEAALRILLGRGDFAVGSHKRFKADDHLSNLLVGLAIGRGSEWAAQVIRAPLEDLPPSAVEANGYAWFVLQYLHVDRVDIPDFDASAQRALAWLTDAVVRANEAIRAGLPGENRPDGLKETFDLVDELVSRLYFNSGIYESSDRPAPSPESVCDFFRLTRDLLATVAEEAGGENPTGLPASTAHHFVQLLRGAVRCDPVNVTHLARLVVAAASGSGYAFDSLASREVTQLVEELLADHREVLREGEPLDDLMFLLDTFVAAGWPEAQYLVFRLEEIFR
jgi:hypothetical protein